MRFRLVSDLHFDHYNEAQNREALARLLPNDEDYDVAMVAGDLANAPALRPALDLLLRCVSKPVLYVPGNHDYSQLPSRSIHDTNAILEALHEQKGHFWNLRAHDYPFKNKAGELRKVMGCTNWYPASSQLVMRNLHKWYDGRYIPYLHAELHHMNVEEGFNLRLLGEGDIVLTHMLPSWNCVHQAYRGESSNVYYVGDRETLIKERRPAFWGFGHTHVPLDLTLGQTRLVCNPRGYPHERPLKASPVYEV